MPKDIVYIKYTGKYKIYGATKYISCSISASFTFATIRNKMATAITSRPQQPSKASAFWMHRITMEGVSGFNAQYLLNRLQIQTGHKFAPGYVFWEGNDLVFFVHSTKLARDITVLDGDFYLYGSCTVRISCTTVLHGPGKCTCDELFCCCHN